ncbi:MAG TPA: hypothetical protein VKB80_09965 [Kofleriaceae bacterium]|nr:hypothetical protein [Kofleriaceae bacterium]
MRRGLARARALAPAAALALVLCAGCPRLPPPAPRPSVSLDRLERAAAPGQWRARLRVHNRGAAGLVVAAVDWELVAGERPLLRGRSPAHLALAPDQRAVIDVALAVPAPVDDELRSATTSGGRLRIRGMVHLVDPGGGEGAPAPFDEAAAPP